MRHRIEIHYCAQCKWLLRSSWMAQEILSTFESEVSELALVPGRDAIFEIKVDGELIWSRERDGGFPDVKTLKSLVRDRVSPGRNLGHIDRSLQRGDQDSSG